MPDVLMPRLSDTMTEGIVTQWLKHEGDTVHRGEVLAEIETDKATMELEAYASGVLSRIIAAPGTTVPIGQPIAVIGDESPTPAPDARPGTAATREPQPVAPTRDTPPVATPTTTDQAPAHTSVRAPVPSSPLARARAREHGMNLAAITGTGPGGRIVRADVEAAIATQGEHDIPPASAVAPPVTGPSVAAAAPDDERIPLSTIRRITAQRLTESAAAPHFYLTSILDAQALLALRAELNGQLAGTGTRISVTDLLIRACALALRTHPEVNSSWGGDHLLRHGQINVGLAVALEDGLIVPVIRDADRKSVSQIAAEAHALTERARAGRLTPDEFSGGTFTISNLGMYGIDHFTAVINPPEAAILAVGAAAQEPVVRDGQLVATTTMKLTLSIDHRVLDGATAAAFLRDLVQLLEHPLRILA
jgi:pyruvate dehydrogenase E2 component (dihydrolipoamide acetyltransferase)